MIRLSRDTMPGRALRAAVVLCVLGGAMVARVPLCPFAISTHVPCPGCGLTRATRALLEGRLGEAVHLHPLSPVVSPLVAVMVLWGVVVYVRGQGRSPDELGGRWIIGGSIVLLAALVGVWIARFFGAFGGPVPV